MIIGSRFLLMATLFWPNCLNFILSKSLNRNCQLAGSLYFLIVNDFLMCRTILMLIRSLGMTFRGMKSTRLISSSFVVPFHWIFFVVVVAPVGEEVCACLILFLYSRWYVRSVALNKRLVLGFINCAGFWVFFFFFRSWFCNGLLQG